ncbi:MAG: hypothetical protein V4651_06380 [Bacteroidota bacterium]
MKIKILYTTLLLLITSVVALPVQASQLKATTAHSEQAASMLQRLETIKEMNIRSMSEVQKSELKKEVQTIHKNLKALDGGVYLSVGAIIVILLILILIL